MLSKQNLFDKDLTLTLSHALDAKSVFQSTSRLTSSNALHHAENAVEQEVLLSLRAKLHLSKSPALAVLPLLLSDEHIQNTFQEYAGIWMTSLAVVIASKPTLRRKNSADHLRLRNFADSDERKEDDSDSDTDKALRISSPSSKEVEAHETRRKSAANMMSTIEGSDFFDHGRVEENKRRESFFRDLLRLRLEEKKDEEHLLRLDGLRAFCEDPLDGNRLLFEYAKQRLRVAQQSDREAVDDTTYERRMAELQRTHKRSAFAALQSFKDMRSRAELAHMDLLSKTRDWCSNLFEKNRNLNKLKQAHAGVDTDGTTSALHGLLPASAYKIDNLEELEAAEMAKLDRLEESLWQEREHLQRSLDERAKTRLAALKDSAHAKLEEDEKRRKDKLAVLDEYSSKAGKDFYSKFIDSMGSSAQLSLAAVDQRFVHGSALEEDERAELMDQIMWDMSERRWQANAADYTQRVFCHNLVSNLDEKLRTTNKSIFKYELERIERVNEYNAKNDTTKSKVQVAV